MNKGDPSGSSSPFRNVCEGGAARMVQNVVGFGQQDRKNKFCNILQNNTNYLFVTKTHDTFVSTWPRLLRLFQLFDTGGSKVPNPNFRPASRASASPWKKSGGWIMVWDEEARNKTLPGSHGAFNGVKRRAGASSSSCR